MMGTTDRVTFNREKLTIELHAGDQYHELDLGQCTDSAGLLDVILDLSYRRPYASLMPEFLECLEEACELVFGQSAQGVYCPAGVDRTVSWRDATSLPKGVKVKVSRLKRTLAKAGRARSIFEQFHPGRNRPVQTQNPQPQHSSATSPQPQSSET